MSNGSSLLAASHMRALACRTAAGRQPLPANAAADAATRKGTTRILRIGGGDEATSAERKPRRNDVNINGFGVCAHAASDRPLSQRLRVRYCPFVRACHCPGYEGRRRGPRPPTPCHVSTVPNCRKRRTMVFWQPMLRPSRSCITAGGSIPRKTRFQTTIQRTSSLYDGPPRAGRPSRPSGMAALRRRGGMMGLFSPSVLGLFGRPFSGQKSGSSKDKRNPIDRA
jgi:hypothetical protein